MTCSPEVQKIGISNDLDHRYKSLQREEHPPTEILFSRAFWRADAGRIEKMVHQRFSGRRIRKDWIRASRDEALAAVKEIISQSGFPAWETLGAQENPDNRAFVISVRTFPTLKQRMSEAAKEDRRTLSQWVEMLIERELATREPKKRR